MTRRQITAFVTGVIVLVAGLGAWMLADQLGLTTVLMDGLFGGPAGSQALTPGPNATQVVVKVQVGAAGRPISPYIYGVAGADPVTLRELGATLNRWGGNPSSRYNWVNGHAWNAGRDWEFRDVNYGNPTGSAADQFVREALSNGATPLLTVPAIGWVARSDSTAIRSVGVPSHGGAPLGPGSSSIAGYDPALNQRLTSVPSLPTASGSGPAGADPAGDPVYQDEWIQHLVTHFGVSPSAVSLMAMDNEPDLWSETHTDVHPAQMSYDSMLQTFEEYAAAVKAKAPDARVLGPDVSGWTSYWYSALDRGQDNFASHADRAAHGNQPFLAWWLAQVAAADRARGSRTLDLLDVHYYPQAHQVDSPISDPATQWLRIRSTRALYDPSYVDESWINEPVMLIPRLKRWIADNYPGTGLAITEYRWGGEDDASGSVALATVLGIFGREGVDVAAYWTYPRPQSPAGAAFRLYANFDGHGSRFGDLSLPATSSDPAVAVFAARNSKTREVDVLLVNQSLQRDATVRLNIGSGASSTVQLYQVLAGSGDITKTGVPPLGSPMNVPAGSLSMIRIVPLGLS